MYSDLSPARNTCTCGYFISSEAGLSAHHKTDLTLQIGHLLVALGKMFNTAPLFKMHINSGTADLLVSIGSKLLRTVKNPSRMM